MPRVLFLVLALSVPGPLAGAAPAPPRSVAQVRERIVAILERTHTPGAGVTLVDSRGTRWLEGIGLAEVATGRPATSDTLFRIGSTSKAFVALSILKLQAEGKLDLNDTLRSRAPDLDFVNPWEATDPVRLVHLLEHTSGWDDLTLKEYASDPPEERTLREGLALEPRTRRSRWRPGTRHSYANGGPAAAAYVVERVTGERYEDYVERNWFRPLRMTTAGFLGTPEVLRRLSVLYRADGRTPYPYWKISVRPSGAINASPRDMLNYLLFHLGRGEFEGVRLLDAAAFARMETPMTTYAAREGLQTGYGLNNYASMREGWVYHGHNGGVMGGLTEFAYQPELGVGYCAMINAAHGAALAEITRAIRDYLTAGAVPPAKPAAVRVPAALAADYAGWYEPISPRNEVWRFADRLLRVTRLKFSDTGAIWRREKFVATSERHFRRERDPMPTLALIADRSEGTLVQAGGTYRRVSVLRLTLEVLAMMGALGLMAGSVAFALVWLPRRLWGDLRGTRHLHVRSWPLVTTIAGAALAAVFLGAGPEIIERLGRVTAWSVALFCLTLAFPLLAATSVISTWRARAAEPHAVVRWHSVATALAASGIAAYLAAWGIIAVRTWA